jgi:lysozyme
MKTSNKVIELIKEFEGFRSEAYQDVIGVWTIGYGSTRVHGLKVVKGMKCSKEEAENYLWDEISEIEPRLARLIKVNVSQGMYDALVDFCYNLGTGNLEKSTLLKNLNAKNYNGAANEFVKWNKAGGAVLAGLTRRREAERDLFISDPISTSVT